MNKERRKRLRDIIDQIETLKTCIEDIQAEEEEACENTIGADRIAKSEDAAYNLEDAVCNLEDVISSLEAAAE